MRCCCAGVRTACHDNLLNLIDGRFFINLDKPALGSLLMLICRMCLSLIRLWSMEGVSTSTCLIVLVELVRMYDR